MAEPKSRVLSDRTLSQRLSRAFLVVAVRLAAILLIIVVCFAAVLGHFEPSVTDLLAGRDAVDQIHSGMVDEETGLRGYIDTGDQTFLSPYYAGAQEILAGNAGSVALATRPDLVGPILDMRAAEQRWLSEWAAPALPFAHTGVGADGVRSFLLTGKTLFDEFRRTEALVAARADADILAEQSAEHYFLTFALGLAIAALMVTTFMARRQQKALRSAVVEPVADLLSTMNRVRSGDLSARPAGVGPPELREVAAGLSLMTDSLVEERSRFAALEVEARAQADRLGLIVTFGRQIAGSLNLRYVAEAVSKAAVSISGFTGARIWLIDEDQHDIGVVHDTSLRHGQAVDRASLQLGEGLVGRAGQFGSTLSTSSIDSLPTEHRADVMIAALAVPMIVGARVVGVLELTSDAALEIDDTSLDVLHSLAGQAATAIEAARFHQRADELSHTDVLTRLPNRRQLELDLDAEVSRSQRYNRPIAFIMLDVDQFKSINDVHGHQAGDEILSEFGNVFAEAMRDTDTAYRYGGEEFCLLLRETDGDAAVIVAERLRADIATRFTGTDRLPMVTASLGVAAIPNDAVDAITLIAAADRALYAAKASGRNCVARATPTPAPRVVRVTPKVEAIVIAGKPTGS